MSDILSRLKALGVTKGMTEVHKREVKKPSEQMDALLKTFPDGIVVENDCGYAFINRLKQPLSEDHGIVDMSSELKPSGLFDSIMEMSIKNKSETLAFDTETSGLSSGSASFIFMLGLGYFENDHYIVDQLILPDLSTEHAFLRQAELIFSRYPILLTYNGKSFDIPMLQSRLRFQMLPDFTKRMAHCDLLKLTRRYWKQALGTVPLSNIEHYVLKLQRGDQEVPGYLAPELYRDFLRGGDASAISGVAYHNRIDVVSLSAFMLYLNDLVIRAESAPNLWRENSVSETALMRYNPLYYSKDIVSCRKELSPREQKIMAGKLLRQGEWDKASEIYKDLTASGDFDAAVKLMQIAQKQKNFAEYEEYRMLAISLLEKDETVGKWTKAEKIRNLRSFHQGK